MVTCFLAIQSCSRCKPEHGRWFSQGGKVSQVEKAVHLGEVAWLASASEILIRILVLGELCLFQVNFEHQIQFLIADVAVVQIISELLI